MLAHFFAFEQDFRIKKFIFSPCPNPVFFDIYTKIQTFQVKNHFNKNGRILSCDVQTERFYTYKRCRGKLNELEGGEWRIRFSPVKETVCFTIMKGVSIYGKEKHAP